MIVDVNPFLIELLGFSHEAFLGKKIWELGFFKDIVANQANFAELQQKEYVRYEDMPLETADGRRIEVEFVSNVYLVNHHKVIQCNIRDITERKRAEIPPEPDLFLRREGRAAFGALPPRGTAAAALTGLATRLMADQVPALVFSGARNSKTPC